MKIRNAKGFTLIELLIVVAFISPDIATSATGATNTKSGYVIELGAGGTGVVAGITACTTGGGAVNSGYTAVADPVSTSTGGLNTLTSCCRTRS